MGGNGNWARGGEGAIKLSNTLYFDIQKYYSSLENYQIEIEVLKKNRNRKWLDELLFLLVFQTLGVTIIFFLVISIWSFQDVKILKVGCFRTNRFVFFSFLITLEEWCQWKISESKTWLMLRKQTQPRGVMCWKRSSVLAWPDPHLRPHHTVADTKYWKF